MALTTAIASVATGLHLSTINWLQPQLSCCVHPGDFEAQMDEADSGVSPD